MLQAKISALEAYKISVVLEDFVKKLTFLDKLKANMGDEMTEQNSEEITKAMEQQRQLEIKYANLVTLRGTLKGISQKNELQETKNEIRKVSNELKGQTKKLCRQLQDNPDVGGNQKLIKMHKAELCEMIEGVMHEMEENQGYGMFQKKIEDDINQQQKYDKLKQEEKDYTNKIKQVNEDLKQKQDEFAKEAGESTEDITRYRKQLNETKVESDLQIQYTKREIDGKLSTMQRLNSQKEADVRQQIKEFKENLDIEKEVSSKIISFINKRKDIISEVSDKREKLMVQQIQKLQDERSNIISKKEEADQEIEIVRQKCQDEEEARILQQQKDDEAAAEEAQKEQEKQDRIIAAKYIEKKWHWFQTEGKFLAKKRKKGKGKGGKKKKK